MKNLLLILLASSSLLTGQAQDTPDGKPSPLADPIKFEHQVDTLVKQYLELDVFSGVVLVADAGESVYHKAFGLANRETTTANTINTKFDIGSMNKTFTKVLVLQLLENGQLKLDDKLGQYLQGFPAEAAENITINHLLNHRSGYGDYFMEAYEDGSTNEPNLQELVQIISRLPLRFPPGSEQDYSNAGYVLLGAIVEKITGKDYYQNVRERILQPLNLTDTYVQNKRTVPERATGYLKTMRGELEDNNRFRDMPMPDGGFQATAADMLRFYREFHYGNQLLKAETKAQDEYYRMIQEHQNSGGAIAHAGGFEGANTVHYEILRDGISVIVFANMDEPVAEQLGAGILAILRGQEPQQPVLPALQQVYQAYTTHGTEYVAENFAKLTTNFHPSDPKDLILNNLGYHLLFDQELAKAIAVFELNTRLFPESANVWDSLGEAYLLQDDRKRALAYYEKALAIDPNLPSARKAVLQLKN
jgi:CubicO group peptidase (beta-lactamase class C family)